MSITEYEKPEKRYMAILLDWIESGFEVGYFDTIEEALEWGSDVLVESKYGHLYAMVPILDSEQEWKVVAQLEKQPLSWNILLLEGEKEIREKSLYRWGDVVEKVEDKFQLEEAKKLVEARRTKEFKAKMVEIMNKKESLVGKLPEK